MSTEINRSWSEDEDKLLRKLHGEGSTMSEIARELASAGFAPRSRNAVIGRAMRLKLSSRSVAVVAANRARAGKDPRARRKNEAPKAPPIAASRHVRGGVPAAPAPVKATVAGWPKPKGPHAVAFLDMPIFGRCRMPLWEGDEPIESKFFCGEPCDAAAVYCPACSALVRGEGAPSERRAHHDIKAEAA